MGTITHLRKLYIEAFDNCKPDILVAILKVYAVFCALMLVMAMYAFVYRAVNGFEF